MTKARKLPTYLLLIITLLAPSRSFSESSFEVTNTDTQYSPTLRWLLETRNYWGKIVGDTGKRLDGFFANTEVIEKTNNSFVKFGLSFKQFKGGRSYIDPKIKFRLDLPTVEKKLRLVFESEPQEQLSITDRNRAQGSNRDPKELNDSTVGALDLALAQKRNWNARTGVGIKFGRPIDPFWRYRINGIYALDQNWEIYSRDSIYYFHDEGWGSHAELTFQFNGPRYVFRQTTDGKYDYSSRRWEFAHTYSFLREISKIRAINYQAGIIAETQPDVQATGYFVHAIYRRKLHREWLFYEMIPKFYYPKEDNWKFSPSITFKIEMVLSSEAQ